MVDTTHVRQPDPSLDIPPIGATSDHVALAEETLLVGKRAIDLGTTRIRRYPVTAPVEATVTLRDETVQLERHPVAAGTWSDADFTPRTIEMTETREEVVITKTTRIVEEISLRKEVVSRVETVRDTVRRDEVEIQHVLGEDRPSIAAKGTSI